MLLILKFPCHQKEQQHTPYILKSNLYPFYSFRGLKYQMRITIACGLDSRSRAGFWKNNAAAIRAVRTIQQFIILFITYYNLLFITFPVITNN